MKDELKRHKTIDVAQIYKTCKATYGALFRNILYIKIPITLTRGF